MTIYMESKQKKELSVSEALISSASSRGPLLLLLLACEWNAQNVLSTRYIILLTWMCELLQKEIIK